MVIEPTAPEPTIDTTFAVFPVATPVIASPAANLNLIVFALRRSGYSGLTFRISACEFAVEFASIITALATPFRMTVVAGKADAAGLPPFAY